MAKTSNIFNSQYTKSEILSTNGAIMTWSTGIVRGGNVAAGDGVGVAASNSSAATLPILVSAFSIRATRDIQSIYPLNQLTKLDIVGPLQGTLELRGLLSSAANDLEKFLTAVGNPCGLTVQITIHTAARNMCDNVPGADPDKTNATYRMTGCLMDTFGAEVRGGEVSTVDMPLGITFSRLDFGVASDYEDVQPIVPALLGE